MPTLIVVLPDLVAGDESQSVLLGDHPVLSQLAEQSQIVGLLPVGNLETPEACYLGMSPDEGQMRPGPLMVAALGEDPPPRSTHFLVSVLGMEGELLKSPEALPDPAEFRQLTDLFRLLNTKSLTLLKGEDLDHALVWEGIGDIYTVPAADATGKPIAESLPKGDLESALRRLIDDSVNVLMGAEFNRIRAEEGRTPLLVLWPWGHGIRYPLPNLALRRGGPVMVQSESFRMAGLARLLGYRPGDHRRYRSGLNLDWPALAKSPPGPMPFVLVASAPSTLRAEGRLEELEWFLNRFENEYLAPMLEWASDREAAGEHLTIGIVTPSAERGGLALWYETRTPPMRPLPFDERTLEERGLTHRNTHELMATLLTRTPQI